MALRHRTQTTMSTIFKSVITPYQFGNTTLNSPTSPLIPKEKTFVSIFVLHPSRIPFCSQELVACIRHIPPPTSHNPLTRADRDRTFEAVKQTSGFEAVNQAIFVGRIGGVGQTAKCEADRDPQARPKCLSALAGVYEATIEAWNQFSI